MSRMYVSFGDRNVRLPSGEWLFPKRHEMRFEWFALLAYKRISQPGDQAWVSREEVAALPSWKGRSQHHIATNIGRYLQAIPETLISGNQWSGPYRLEVNPLSISFDIPQATVPQQLHFRRQIKIERRQFVMRDFTFHYVRAQCLFFRGRLGSPANRGRSIGWTDSAFERLRAMMQEDKNYSPTLRLVACLAAVDVLFRLGKVKAARETLDQNRQLTRHTTDASLKAQFHLRMAWAIQRASSSTQSNRAVESALWKAGALAENSGDRASLGLLAYRTAGYLTKLGRHSEAVDHLISALESYLITGNFHSVQAACTNIGSIVHRLGPKHYGDAREWLLTSIIVGRWMRLGRDDAHAEMILAKIYTEQGKEYRARWLLKRAERIAENAGNRINLADVKMVSGFWHERFGSEKDQVKTLAEAVRLFRKFYEFDVNQKETYMRKHFPKVWGKVVELVERQP